MCSAECWHSSSPSADSWEDNKQAKQMELQYLQRIPPHLTSVKRLNSERSKSVKCAFLQLNSSAANLCPAHTKQEKIVQKMQEQSMRKGSMLKQLGFQTKRCLTVNLLWEFCTTGTTTIGVSQMTRIRQRNFCYILEIYSSTPETKDELSKCLGFCVYQLPELVFCTPGRSYCAWNDLQICAYYLERNRLNEYILEGIQALNNS